jgi:hypothetical protein
MAVTGRQLLFDWTWAGENPSPLILAFPHYCSEVKHELKGFDFEAIGEVLVVIATATKRYS